MRDFSVAMSCICSPLPPKPSYVKVALTQPNYETHWRDSSSLLLSNTVLLRATQCFSGCGHFLQCYIKINEGKNVWNTVCGCCWAQHIVGCRFSGGFKHCQKCFSYSTAFFTSVLFTVQISKIDS